MIGSSSMMTEDLSCFFLLMSFHDARIVEFKCCRIDVLAVRIIVYYQDFWLTWIIDV